MFNCECGAELIQDDCETILDVCQEAPVVKDYETLANKPQINGVTLDGNKTSEDLGITQEITEAVSAEATLRENADTALGGRIDQEITARGNADTALGGRIDGEITNRTNADNALGTRIDNEILARQGGDNNLQSQIDAITSKSDVVDVVSDYAALQAYDTQHLGNNDVIKVLDDETHDDAQTYYRWNKTAGTWSYIGSEAPYYSKGQMDVMLQGKQDKLTAGANIQIQNGTISATDTTYTAGNGLNLNGTEFSADTDVLATKEDLEGYYTKSETDNLLAPKLEAEVVAELPTTGAEGKLYLTPKAHTTSTATGNPIEATITAQAGQLESFQLDGDTEQQAYTGKNLCNPSTFVKGRLDNGVVGYTSNTTSLTVEGNSITYTTNANYRGIVSDYIPVEPNTEYTFSRTIVGELSVSALIDVFESDSEAGWITRLPTATFTTPSNCRYVRVSFQNYASGTATVSNIMVEKSATATTFEPYVGGQPSPNPDYPQQIQTVTGTQTISINGTNYPIDLGDIQLCGLGDDGNDNPLYKDYIYPDGEDWKVHKATATITLDGTEAWVYADNYNYARCPSYTFVDKPLGGTSVGLQLSNYFGVIADWGTFRDSTGQNAFFPLLDEGYKISIRNTGCSSVENYISWLTANKPSFYYPLATPTDTVITDTDLIAQLEAIRTAALQNGTNTITNTATGTNLAGDMEIGYFGFNPTNRYDKWLWLDLNNNYEQIGS